MQVSIGCPNVSALVERTRRSAKRCGPAGGFLDLWVSANVEINLLK